MAGRYGLELRGAAAADASGLAELFAAAGHRVSARALAERLEAMRGQSGAVLIAGEWGPPSGIIALSWRTTLAADRPAARIEHLLVHPDARRRGIGRLLLKAGAQAARSAGCDRLELSVEESAPSLEAFGTATGFVPNGAAFVRALRKSA